MSDQRVYKQLKGFSRYKFYLSEGFPTVVNISTKLIESRVQLSQDLIFSLTNDKGKRCSVSGEEIKKLFEPEVKPEPVKKKRKFTDDQVKEIKRLLSLPGASQKALAIQYEVDQSTISDIKRGIIYKNI